MAQRAVLHGAPETPIQLCGEPIEGPDGAFAGFRGQISGANGEEQRPVQPGSAFEELLREPLDTIISEAEQIASRNDGPLRSDYAAYASDIASAGRHLLEVLRSLGKEPVAELERVNLAALARDAVSLVQPQADERGVRIEQEGTPELAVRAQARPVTQILVNLIGNAARHSPYGRAVQVIVSGGEVAKVTVADQGPGVADRDRERIFERFEQAEPREDGAGLGLAISRRLARSLGGDISLDSREGEGARFTLTLPLD
jgi:signal transduction histidine kinase